MEKNRLKIFQFLMIVTSCTLTTAADNNTLTPERKLKAFGVFNVVRFPNDPCVGLNGAKNGTCYTASECTTKNGVSVGTCADSFGVCCTFTIGCGGISRENCTFFDSPAGIGAGACAATICKNTPGICSLRLDFNMFVISGPSTQPTVGAAVGDVGLLGGNVVPIAAGSLASTRTECLTDTFSVTGTGSGNPPIICGSNTLQHIYVDASEECNKMAFQLGNNGIGTAVANRQWSIKVTQISCMNPNLPPPGCTQYFFGPTTGTVQSFNFATNTLHLASQDQTICFRRERGFCRICFIPTATVIGTNDFIVSGKTATKGFTQNSFCCGYGNTGKNTKGYDCLLIPGASKFTGKTVLAANQFCGDQLVTANDVVSTGKSICTAQTPFQIQFISDAFEWAQELTATRSGFKLSYTEISC